MLHLEAVEYSALELLRKLQNLSILRDTCLVGGTALILQLGHRRSTDLDFFGAITCEAGELISVIEAIASLIVLKESPHIHIYLVGGIKVGVVNYRYQWLDKPVIDRGVRMVGIKDIATMGVMAAIDRGTKRDFIDISSLLHHLSLSEILNSYSTRYDDGSVFIAMKGLMYFDDAEKEPMSDTSINKFQEQVKEYILSRIS